MPTDQTDLSQKGRGLRSHDWLLSYRTSTTAIDGRPLDMLHDFYIPALSRAVQYDRMAGYFRSSSLAAASQGFSAFVGRGGKMRLVVGADLEPADVKAILAGDKERLARRLNSELEQPAAWPQEVQNGVTLLGWMVAHDYLEVRIAFRVHGQTGEPLSLDAVDDGYVHEKWFILHDEFGQRLYGAGTLNESKTALVLNAENIDVHCDWWGGNDYHRVKQADADFEQLWQGNSPYVAVLTIPEAVRQRLITLSKQMERPLEVDGSSAAPKTVPSPSALERLQFAVLKDAPQMPDGRYVGLETAPVAPWPHQAVVVRRLVATWPHSYLLCDEVGLGKTIEAGLAFRSLYLSGLVKRILVAPPASLTEQWQRQMAEKMLLSFARALTGTRPRHQYIFPEEEEEAASCIYDPDLVIVSTGLLARADRKQALLMARPFDIALVDEAHAARRQNANKGVGAHPNFGRLYIAVRDCLRRKTSSLWLATATPMQIHPVEVCDLLALTDRVGAFQYDATLTLQYYEILAKIIHGQDPEKEEWEFLRRSVCALQMQDPLPWRYLQNSVIDGRIQVALRRWLEDGFIPRGRDRKLICRLLFSASPLSRVMLRHTRRLLEIYREKGELKENLARRHILPLPRITFAPLEQLIYDRLEDYCNGLTRQIRKHGDGQAQTAMGFLLSFFRLRFASSLYALRETLQRRLVKVEATLEYQLTMETAEGLDIASLQEQVTEGEGEDDAVAVESLLKNRSPADLRWERERLKTMIADMADLTGPSPKMRYLLSKLDQRRDAKTGRIKQTVVFTRFYDTLVDIVTHLRRVDPEMLIGTYSGQGQGGEYLDPSDRQMVAVNREDVKERFLRGGIDVLVCTDAAAEGLNLQTADLLVNFDLGWNPMKVEQRIGRIDRIGQKHKDISVLNLCYANTAEETVYVRLLDRLAKANLIVGTQQLSLLPVGPEDFQKLAEKKISEEQLMALAKERITQQRERTESMEMDPQDLYEIYTNMSSPGGEQLGPVDLEDIWEALSQSEYLRSLGCAISTRERKSVLKVVGVTGVPDGAILTVTRELYEEGLAGERSRVHFASYGDPYFQAILTQVTEFELPSCIRRIAVSVPGLDEVEVAAYAVAGRKANDEPTVQLIKSWADLKKVQLAEDVVLTEAAIKSLQEELAQIAREEFKPCLAAKIIERDNKRAAKAQQLLRLLVIHSWLKMKARFAGEGALFWPALAEVEAMFKDRKVIRTDELPADVLGPIAGDLLFACNIPTVGSNAYVRVPRILAKSSVDVARQVADRMKVGKSGLKAESVLARIQREAEKWRQIL